MIDWQQVTLNLRTNYTNLSAIAKEIGSDWAHLNRLARGEVNAPRWDTGIALLDLHYDKCRHLHKSELIGKP